MYNVKRFMITKKNSELYKYCADICHKYKNLYNVSNFYIRQVMTGIKKDTNSRQPNETEILNIIQNTLPEINQVKQNLYNRKYQQYLNGQISKEPILDLKQYPTPDKWFLDYYFLELLLRYSKNADYLALPAQVNQMAIRECCQQWLNYFSSLKKYKRNPELFTGYPKIPHYLKSDKHTVKLTNIVCKLKQTENKTYLRFPATKAKLWLGQFINTNASLKQVEIKPIANHFEILIVIEDGCIENTVTVKSNRIIGIDLGIDNFATITNNVSLPSVIIKGNMIKSRNQWYNKEHAKLKSILALGHESDKHQQSSKRIQNLWAKRTRYMRDYMHKISCAVIQYCIDNNIDTIVIGKNDGWKINSNMGHINNQNFVQIPYEMFIEQLTYKANRHGIRIIAREESYTSKASFLDMDNIPDYDSSNQTTYIFSGKRTKRGLYVSGKGISINADVNGSANIIRKEFPDAFLGMDIMYVRKTQTWNERKWYTSKTA